MSQNLSGLWIGEYRYPAWTAMPPVSFRVHVSDQGGAFSGNIDEDGAPPSVLRGTREGSSVTFSKRYSSTGNGRFLDRILYEGGLNEDATRIDGRWSVFQKSDFSGDFFMMRDKPKAQKKAVIREAEIV